MELEFLFYLYLFVQSVRFIVRIVVTWTLIRAAIWGQNDLTSNTAYLFGTGIIELVANTGFVALVYLFGLCGDMLLGWFLAGLTAVNILRLAAFLSFTYQFYWGKDE